LTWRDSIDFFLCKPPPPCGGIMSGESASWPREERFMVLTLSWMNVSKAFGASSGWTLAGTQNSRDGSSSSASCDGATVGTVQPELKEGRSGSAACTSIDILRMACRLLSSWATAAVESRSVRGKCCSAGSEGIRCRAGGDIWPLPDAACPLRPVREPVGDMSSLGDCCKCSTGEPSPGTIGTGRLFSMEDVCVSGDRVGEEWSLAYSWALSSVSPRAGTKLSGRPGLGCGCGSVE